MADTGRQSNEISTTGDIAQYIVVKFDQEQYGVDINFIQNIVRMSRITRVPKAPDYIKGVINLRGEIIPVMSLRSIFDMAADEYTSATRIIIVKVDGSAIGLIVDEVLEVIQLPEENIEKLVRDKKNEKSKYVFAVGKVGDDLVSLLHIKAIVGEDDD